MARTEKQTDAPAPPAIAPSSQPEMPASGQDPAVQALLHRADAYEADAKMHENVLKQLREDIANREAVIARDLASAAACRAAIQRLSN